MSQTIKSVEEFHKAFGIVTADRPVNLETNGEVNTWLSLFATQLEGVANLAYKAAEANGADTSLLRVQLMVEELGELVRAMQEADAVGVLDALCDMRYVNDGTVLSLGLGAVFMDAFNEVHRSNMSKLVDGRPLIDEAGRVVKGPDYWRPKLEKFVE